MAHPPPPAPGTLAMSHEYQGITQIRRRELVRFTNSVLMELKEDWRVEVLPFGRFRAYRPGNRSRRRLIRIPPPQPQQEPPEFENPINQNGGQPPRNQPVQPQQEPPEFENPINQNRGLPPRNQPNEGNNVSAGDNVNDENNLMIDNQNQNQHVNDGDNNDGNSQMIHNQNLRQQNQPHVNDGKVNENRKGANGNPNSEKAEEASSLVRKFQNLYMPEIMEQLTIAAILHSVPTRNAPLALEELHEKVLEKFEDKTIVDSEWNPISILNCISKRISETGQGDEEELDEVDVGNEADQLGQSSKEDPMISFPSRNGYGVVEIRYSDLKCLNPETYLSTPIMDYYIWYLQEPTSIRKHDYYFFNTYFYEKLKPDAPTKEPSFSKLRKWWKGVDIFKKAYIFLPINEGLHWSLAIICMPNKEDGSGPIILHLDSLGFHTSKSIFRNVKSFLIGEWECLKKEELCVPPIAENIWNKLPERIDDEVIEVPQQENGYDCGLFVLSFIEHFIVKAEEEPERLKKPNSKMFGSQWFEPEEASSLRTTIRDSLTNGET